MTSKLPFSLFFFFISTAKQSCTDIQKPSFVSRPLHTFFHQLHNSFDFHHLWARYHINLYKKLIEVNVLHWQSIAVPKHLYPSFLFNLQQYSLIFNQSFTCLTVLSVRTCKYTLLPQLVQAVFTTKAPCKMLHWKVMFHSEKSAFQKPTWLSSKFCFKTKFLISSQTWFWHWIIC